MIKPHYLLHTVLIFNVVSAVGGNALWRSSSAYTCSVFGKVPDL